MRIRFQSRSDRLKLMSWHRRFCKSSPIQAKQFVDSIPCEIEIDSLDYYIYSDGGKQLKDIAVFEILPDFPEPQSINSCCFPTCGCEYQPANFISFPNDVFITNGENK